MILQPVADRIAERSRIAGLAPPPDLVTGLAAYLDLLARWNTRINLTAFQLDSPTDAAIDRLLIEPIAAAEWVAHEELVAVDIGSGGGSPAIPLKLARPNLRMTMVEARTKKSVFLRDAVQALRLTHVEVETRRIDRPANVSDALRGKADVVTLRGVRADRSLLNAVLVMLKAGGRFISFGESVIQPIDGLEVGPAIPAAGSTAQLFTKRL